MFLCQPGSVLGERAEEEGFDIVRCRMRKSYDLFAVRNILRAIRREKIDIVTWDPDPAKFICNALAPAEIVRVVVDEADQTMEVVVPDDQLSLAIGKRGQNVRLASKLSGWNLHSRFATHIDTFSPPLSVEV